MEVLRPHDCLVDRFRTHPSSDAFTRRRNCYGFGRYARSARKQANNNILEKKRYGYSYVPRRSKSEEDVRSSVGNGSGGLVSGHVTILKRGESLDSRVRNLEMKKKKERDAVGMMMMMVCGVGRLGPEPEVVPREEMKAFVNRRCIDMYAGSAFAVSPSPNDLPLPSFHYKKSSHLSSDNSATRDLRRLLGLR